MLAQSQQHRSTVRARPFRPFDTAGWIVNNAFWKRISEAIYHSVQIVHAVEREKNFRRRELLDYPLNLFKLDRARMWVVALRRARRRVSFRACNVIRRLFARSVCEQRG
ncbi:hypothetical protein OKW38_004674 [Paraburkholderia sp. MM5496-R1]|uniref:hypothetical protein n=1 Tax=Paraburkholderia sp. MM5496-R1 TaxID=2991065 RepID=UPI003D1A56A3